MNVHGFLHPFVSVLTPVALASVAAGTLVLGAALLLATFLRRQPARVRYSFLYATLLLFALPLHLVFFAAVAGQGELRSLFDRETVQRATTASAIGPVRLPVEQRRDIDWECPLSLALAAGAIGGALLLVRRAFGRRTDVAQASAANPHVVRAVDEIRAAMGVREPIPVVVLPGVTAPAAVAVRHPVLVVPDSALQRLSEAELRAVLAHEVAHVARRDNLAAIVESFIGAVFWFNPLIWVMRRRIALERERACDEAAVERHASPEIFLSALHTLCRETLPERRAVASCISSSKISERVDSLMNYTRLSDSRMARLAVFCAALLFSVGTVVSIAFVTEKPVFAQQGDHKFTFEIVPTRLSADSVQFDLKIVDRAGEVISQPRIVTRIGEGAETVSGTDDGGVKSEIRVNVRFLSPQRAEATMMIKENDAIIYTQARQFDVPETGAPVFTGQPIDMRLKDADLRDVLGTFAQITGTKIQVDARVKGKVTVDFDDVPWDEALHRILTSNGLTSRVEGKVIHVEYAAEEPQPSRTPRVTEGITPPQVITRVEPIYPASAKEKRIQGIVILRTVIDVNGDVTAAEILKPLPEGMSEAALVAVKQWKFQPALKDGVPTEVEFNVLINFKLDE